MSIITGVLQEGTVAITIAIVHTVAVLSPLLHDESQSVDPTAYSQKKIFE
jgi:hypothetical protein